MCPNAENETCSNTNCSCSASNRHIDRERFCEKVTTRLEPSEEGASSPELPNLTPDIGFSCFHFPDFSRKLHQGKDGRNLLLENQPLVKRNQYGKVSSAESDEVQLSISMNDLYLRANKSETDSESESSKMLLEKDMVSQQSKARIDSYCQMSQIPHMRNIKYSRLNSYSETDVSNDIIVAAEFETTPDNVGKATPSGYENNNTKVSQNCQSISPAVDSQGKTVDNSKVELKRMDSDPYCKLAIGNDGNSVCVNVFDDLPQTTVTSGCDQHYQKDNCPTLDKCRSNKKDKSVSGDTSEKLTLNCNHHPVVTNQQPKQVDVAPYVQHGSQPSSPAPVVSNPMDEIEPYILISEI